EKGRVVAISAPASAKLPSEQEVLALVKTASSAEVAAWQDVPSDKPLVATPPAPGKVVKTTHDTAPDATVWTLANGIRVAVKPTAFQSDSSAFTGWGLGGSSLVPDKAFVRARFADDVVSVAGVGDFDAITLRKMLAGKVVTGGVALGELAGTAFGSTRPAD